MAKIIGAGFGRTGTMSLKLALERLLGGTCYHMIEVLQARPQDIALWRQASRGEPIDWAAMFQDYPAAVDWPVARFYRELYEAFPDAKFVLTVREPEAWYTSAVASIYQLTLTVKRFPVSLLVRCLGQRANIPAMADEVIWNHHFDGRFTDRQHAIAVFNQHIEDVKAHIPAAQLLVFEVKDGWEPLCAFLGVDSPDGPFPRANETAVFKQRIRTLELVSWVALLVAIALVVAVGFGIASLGA